MWWLCEGTIRKAPWRRLKGNRQLQTEAVRRGSYQDAKVKQPVTKGVEIFIEIGSSDKKIGLLLPTSYHGKKRGIWREKAEGRHRCRKGGDITGSYRQNTSSYSVTITCYSTTFLIMRTLVYDWSSHYSNGLPNTFLVNVVEKRHIWRQTIETGLTKQRTTRL